VLQTLIPEINGYALLIRKKYPGAIEYLLNNRSAIQLEAPKIKVQPSNIGKLTGRKGSGKRKGK
jgi:hypothetical protein